MSHPLMTPPPAPQRTGLCLSIQQPWAWLITNGYKGIENRDWPTKVRGWIGIHAGKKIDAEGLAWVRDEFPEIGLPDEYAMGGIVGRAQLVGCVHVRDGHLLVPKDQPWFFGTYGFVLDSAEVLPLRPCRGMLGFFRPTFTPEATHV